MKTNRLSVERISRCIRNARASALAIPLILFFGHPAVVGDSGEAAPGLVGAWYGNSDFTNCKDAELVKTLDLKWSEADDHGREWSANWEGFVAAPATGEVAFHIETDESASVQIDGTQVAWVLEGNDRACHSGTVSMTKGEEYPIVVTYSHDGDFDSYLRITWSWAGRGRVPIPAENLRHTREQARHWNWVSEQDMVFDPSAFASVPARHVIVYQEPGKFCAWPANNGAWSWGNEILVGFELCTYKEAKFGHSRDNSQPELKVLARSLDGGESWTMEDPDHFADDPGLEAVPCPGNIDFAHPDFALRTRGDNFFVSYDRGKRWQGPYLWPDFGTGELSGRTDYIVNGPDDCLVFLAAQDDRVEAEFQDRAFCARTTDGGKTFQFLGWMTHDTTVRSVMPATVRISDTELVSAMRRRHDIRRDNLPHIMKNWIDVYRSTDNGKTWEFLSKVADTDRGERNGNPPSMVRLRDGRLCVAYGYRSKPFGIRAKLSSDNGKTWSKPILLRDDGRTWDIGYTRMVQRPDGKLVTIYYFTTEQNRQQHIAATIWDPDKVQ